MELIDIAIVIAYLIGTLIIGYIKGKNIKSLKEYAISNREFTTPVLVAAVAATLIGGGSSTGLAAKVFTYGVPFYIIFFGRPLVNLFLAYFVAPRMESFQGTLSLAEIGGRLYGKSAQILIGSLGLIRSIGFLGTQVTAIGFVFEYFMGIDYVYGASLGSLIVVIYTSYGGIRSVTFTDVLQFTLLIVAIPLIANICVLEVGGYQKLYASVKDTHFSLPTEEKELSYLSAMFVYSMLPMIDPVVIHRFLMAPNVKEMGKSLKITALLQFPFYALVTVIGLSAFVLTPEIDANHSIFTLVNNYIAPGFKGVCVAAIIAILMSTGDSYLNTSSVLLSNDVIRPLFGREIGEKDLLLITRILALVAGVFAVVIALKFKDILDIGVYFASFWAPIAVMPLYAGIFGLRPSSRSFFAGVVGGVTTFLLWDYFGKEILPIIPAFLIGMIGNFVCLMTHYILFDPKPRKSPQENRPTMEQAIAEAKEIMMETPSFWKRARNMLYQFCQFEFNTLKYKDMPVISYAVFTLLIYNMPSFVWEGGPLYLLKHLFYIKAAGSVMSVALLLRNYWPPLWKAYFPAFWHGVLIYNLPFVCTLYAISTGFETMALINLSFALFLLGLMTSWRVYIFSFFAGMFSGFAVYQLWCTGGCFLFPQHAWVFFLFAVIFATLMGSIFSRQNENILISQMRQYRSLASQIAHELCSPLQNINIDVGMLGQYMRSKKDDRAEEMVEELSDNAKMLSKRINLAMGTLKGRDTRLMPQALNVHSLLKHIRQAYPNIDEECVEVRVDLKGIPPKTQIKVDPIAFEHVLHNLMKNAFEAIGDQDRDGKLEITGKIKGKVLSLMIKDNGSGIPPALIGEIFQPFVTSKTMGTGIGLYFCKHVLSMMEIKLSIHKSSPEGTEMLLEIPV